MRLGDFITRFGLEPFNEGRMNGPGCACSNRADTGV
jgi:hypothetical protein